MGLAEQVRQARGTVQWGVGDKVPKTPVVVAKDGQRLEALAPGPPKLPITLTLSIKFAGSPPNSKPELFTFPIVRFSSDGQSTQQPTTSTNSTDHSGIGHASAAPGDKSSDTLERHPAH